MDKNWSTLRWNKTKNSKKYKEVKKKIVVEKFPEDLVKIRKKYSRKGKSKGAFYESDI